jgi:hypothetical protein
MAMSIAKQSRAGRNAPMRDGSLRKDSRTNPGNPASQNPVLAARTGPRSSNGATGPGSKETNGHEATTDLGSVAAATVAVEAEVAEGAEAVVGVGSCGIM